MTQLTAYSKIIDQRHQNDPWIIMVHGFSHNCGYFAAQVTEFQKDHRILLTDLRGHGQSSQMDGPFGIEEYADDIGGLIADAGIEKAHYWGTHTGSAIGLVLALRNPSLFTSLILEGTFLPGFAMPSVGQLLDKARGIAQTRSVAEAVEDWFDHADWFDYINAHPKQCRADELRTLTRTFTGAPWLCNMSSRPVMPAADHLDQIQQPVLFYNGSHDMADFKAAAEKLRSRLPHGQGAVIENGGGFPGWEDPMAVNKLVRMFLSLI